MPRKLGKGLGAIFGEDVDVVSLIDDIQKNATSDNTNEIPLDRIRINPYQPRTNFDESAIDELAQSIKQHGVFTPILVREGVGNDYELIAGERRFRAAKKAGLTTIPAIIRNFNDAEMMEIAILENIQRENLSAIEEANGYAKLMEHLGYTQEQVAQRVGKSREHVTNLLRLLKLDPTVQQWVMDNQISNSTARALLGLKDTSQQVPLAKEIMANGLSTRAVEAKVKALNSPKSKKETEVDPYLEDLSRQIESKLQTKVVVSKKRMIIEYSDTDDLNRILDQLGLTE